MVNYLVKNVEFFKSVTDYFCLLIQRANKEKLKFIPKEKEFQTGDLTDVEPPKSEFQIFQDIVDNCLTLIITGYGFYTLSSSTKEQVEIVQQTQSLIKKAEEDKQQVRKDDKKKEKGEDQKDKEMSEEARIYPDRVLSFITNLRHWKYNGPDASLNNIDGMLSSWNKHLSEEHFNKIALALIEHAGDNFDLSFTQSSFQKLMYLLLKLLENQENSDTFLRGNWFKKLLNIKSKLKHKGKWRNYFTSIVIKLMEDENAILEASENIIRKILYFKHDEEFSKEIRKNKEMAIKKRKKETEQKDQLPQDDDNQKSQGEAKADATEEDLNPGEETKQSKLKEESLIIKKSESSDAVAPSNPSLIKNKRPKGSESTVLKKSDIAYLTFKN